MQNLNFNELSRLFLEDYIHQVQPSTFKKVDRLFNNHFIPDFNQRLVSSISLQEMQQYVYRLNTMFVRYKKHYCYLKRCFNFAEKRNYIAFNPCTDISLPKELKMPPKRKLFLEVHELQAFLSACLHDPRPYIHVFFSSSCRFWNQKTRNNCINMGLC